MSAPVTYVVEAQSAAHRYRRAQGGDRGLRCSVLCIQRVLDSREEGKSFVDLFGSREVQDCERSEWELVQIVVELLPCSTCLGCDVPCRPQIRRAHRPGVPRHL